VTTGEGVFSGLATPRNPPGGYAATPL